MRRRTAFALTAVIGIVSAQTAFAQQTGAAGKPNILVIFGYKEFPPSQRAASFTIDQAMDKMRQGFGK